MSFYGVTQRKSKTARLGRVVFVGSESAVNIPKEMIDYGTTKTAQLVRYVIERLPCSLYLRKPRRARPGSRMLDTAGNIRQQPAEDGRNSLIDGGQGENRRSNCRYADFPVRRRRFQGLINHRLQRLPAPFPGTPRHNYGTPNLSS
jgi:hypothetical protein